MPLPPAALAPTGGAPETLALPEMPAMETPPLPPAGSVPAPDAPLVRPALPLAFVEPALSGEGGVELEEEQANPSNAAKGTAKNDGPMNRMRSWSFAARHAGQESPGLIK